VINTLAITSDVTTNSKFLVSVASLDLDSRPGPADHFDPTQEYHWTLVHAAGGITGFAPQKFAIDRSAFVNPTGAGTFNITQSSNDLVLNFNPVPEPVVLWLAPIAMLGMRRRRRGRC